MSARNCFRLILSAESYIDYRPKGLSYLGMHPSSHEVGQYIFILRLSTDGLGGSLSRVTELPSVAQSNYPDSAT